MQKQSRFPLMELESFEKGNYTKEKHFLGSV